MGMQWVALISIVLAGTRDGGAYGNNLMMPPVGGSGGGGGTTHGGGGGGAIVIASNTRISVQNFGQITARGRGFGGSGGALGEVFGNNAQF